MGCDIMLEVIDYGIFIIFFSDRLPIRYFNSVFLAIKLDNGRSDIRCDELFEFVSGCKLSVGSYVAPFGVKSRRSIM